MQPLKVFPCASMFMIILALLTRSANGRSPTETKMVLYFHEFAAGPNATMVPIAGIAGKLWTFSQFGTVYAVDDAMTTTPDLGSGFIGQSQGIFVTSALDGSHSHVMISLVFTNGAYNGSTLQIQGTSKQFQTTREVSVVGGTGRFRHTRRYATLETYYQDALRLTTSSDVTSAYTVTW